MHPSCEWLWLRVGVTEKRFVKMQLSCQNTEIEMQPPFLFAGESSLLGMNYYVVQLFESPLCE